MSPNACSNLGFFPQSGILDAVGRDVHLCLTGERPQKVSHRSRPKNVQVSHEFTTTRAPTFYFRVAFLFSELSTSKLGNGVNPTRRWNVDSSVDEVVFPVELFAERSTAFLAAFAVLFCGRSSAEVKIITKRKSVLSSVSIQRANSMSPI